MECSDVGNMNLMMLEMFLIGIGCKVCFDSGWLVGGKIGIS